MSDWSVPNTLASAHLWGLLAVLYFKNLTRLLSFHLRWWKIFALICIPRSELPPPPLPTSTVGAPPPAAWVTAELPCRCGETASGRQEVDIAQQTGNAQLVCLHFVWVGGWWCLSLYTSAVKTCPIPMFHSLHEKQNTQKGLTPPSPKKPRHFIKVWL